MKKIIVCISIFFVSAGAMQEEGKEIPSLKSLCIERVAAIGLSKDGKNVNAVIDQFKEIETLQHLPEQIAAQKKKYKKSIMMFSCATFKVYTNWIDALVCINDTIPASESEDKTIKIKILDMAKNVGISTLKGHASRLKELIANIINTTLASASDRALKILRMPPESLNARQMLQLCALAQRAQDAKDKAENKKVYSKVQAQQLKDRVDALFSDEDEDQKFYKKCMFDYLQPMIEPKQAE